MKPSHIRGLIRTLGSLAGVGAIVAAGIGAKRFLGSSETDFWSSQLVAPWFFILACLLLRATYLAWFRWSPLAIRHGLAVLFFFPTIYGSVRVSTFPSRWIPPLFLIGIAAGYLLYRYTAAVLTQRAFPASVGDLACSHGSGGPSDSGSE
jgi:hypothetical protein